MVGKQTIKDVNIDGKVILLRADYNVPLVVSSDVSGTSAKKQASSASGLRVESNLRIRASLPTINYLLDHGARKIIVISHLGRPEGQINLDFSLSPVAFALQKLLPDRSVIFINGLIGDSVSQKIQSAPDGSIILLENLRFYREEEANSSAFAKSLIKTTQPDLFVQDGFAVAHRTHASTDAITKEVPSVAGLLLDHEIKNLESAVRQPAHPLTVIIGGAKVADKQPLIDHFLDRADHIIVGGKIAADGFVASNPKIYVAFDFVADESGARLDLGPHSTAEIIKIIESSKTVIWNGTLGLVENPAFAKSSTTIAKAIGQNPHLTSIICGGDTTGFIENLQSTHPDLKYSLVSTGGGASLEFILGLPLPGYESLIN